VKAIAQEHSTQAPSKQLRIPTEKAAAITAENPSRDNRPSARGQSISAMDPITEEEEDDYDAPPADTEEEEDGYETPPFNPESHRNITRIYAEAEASAEAADESITPPPSLVISKSVIDQQLAAIGFAGVKKSTVTKPTAVRRTKAQPDDFEYEHRDLRNREYGHQNTRNHEYERRDLHNHEALSNEYEHRDQHSRNREHRDQRNHEHRDQRNREHRDQRNQEYEHRDQRNHEYEHQNQRNREHRDQRNRRYEHRDLRNGEYEHETLSDEYEHRDQHSRNHEHRDQRNRESKHRDTHNRKYKYQNPGDRDYDYQDTSDLDDDDLEPEPPVKPVRNVGRPLKVTAVTKKQPCELIFIFMHHPSY
jgi:hypothetical protein